MKNKLFILAISVLVLTSCSKKFEGIGDIINKGKNTVAVTNEYIKYTILKGDQYSDKSNYAAVKYGELIFNVKFDSSAVYKTIKKENQKDINKLFGFSDNKADHHQFSARFGWRWSDNALRLFAYTYNNGTMSSKEMGEVQIGKENLCSIKVAADKYLFTLNDSSIAMPRTATTALAEGYQLWPYFGGDESAPHTISIWIKRLESN